MHIAVHCKFCHLCIIFKTNSYHPLLSDNPLHKGSVRTFLSISFFHSIPSEITLYHSLQTVSAAHKDLASKKDRIFSAIWSKPLAVEQYKECQSSETPKSGILQSIYITHGQCFQDLNQVTKFSQVG